MTMYMILSICRKTKRSGIAIIMIIILTIIIIIIIIILIILIIEPRAY